MSNPKKLFGKYETLYRYRDMTPDERRAYNLKKSNAYNWRKKMGLPSPIRKENSVVRGGAAKALFSGVERTKRCGVSLYLSLDLIDRLHNTAQALGQSKTDIANEAIEVHLRKLEKKHFDGQRVTQPMPGWTIRTRAYIRLSKSVDERPEDYPEFKPVNSD